MARQQSIAGFYRKTEKWREQFNPLRGLTITRAIGLLEAYRRGEMADLQWLYSHIEETDATLLALVERRTSALIELDWDIRTIAEEDLPGSVRKRFVGREEGHEEGRGSRDDDEGKGSKAIEEMAEEQRDYLRECYDRIDNLREALEFLALATFRGYAHVQRQDRDGDGLIDHLEPLDQWNWIRDGMYGEWFWNPKAQVTTADALRNSPDSIITPADFIIREVPRHIDRIALIKFIRANLAEKDWTAFVEIYGIPGGVVTMPPQVPESERDNYLEMARDVAAGGNGVIPNGGAWTPNDGPRGTNPFQDFLRFQDEKLVLAGTGGLLTMLAQSGSGTLAGNAHQETFQAIARADGVKLSELFQEQFDKVLIRQKFGPDVPILAYFELSRSEAGAEEMQFKRDVLKAFLSDGTVVDVIANLTNMRDLIAEVGLPQQPDYEEPWLPVTATAGPKVTGEVVKDSEGDIVGGDFEEPPAPEPGAGLFNRRVERVPTAIRREFARGVSEDLRPVGELINRRLAEIEKMSAGPDRQAALARLLAEIEAPGLKAQVLESTQAAEVLAKALFEGMRKGKEARREGQ